METREQGIVAHPQIAPTSLPNRTKSAPLGLFDPPDGGLPPAQRRNQASPRLLGDAIVDADDFLSDPAQIEFWPATQGNIHAAVRSKIQHRGFGPLPKVAPREVPLRHKRHQIRIECLSEPLFKKTASCRQFAVGEIELSQA
jgi:hypothetical protein